MGGDGFASDCGRVVGRVGETVRRRPGPWTPAVHGLLRYLEAVSFPYSPRVLGFDGSGCEVLTYIPGESGRAGWAKVVPYDGLRAFARVLRAYHDAVAGYRPATAGWAAVSRLPAPGEVICHGDFGPWNVVWQGGVPVGVLDWDVAGPRRALFDVAYALEYTVPFRDDRECVRWLGYPQPPRRAERLEVFAEAYGLPSCAGLVEEVVRVQREAVRTVRVLAGRGVQPQAGWVAAGHLDELARRAEWTTQNRRLFVGG